MGEHMSVELIIEHNTKTKWNEIHLLPIYLQTREVGISNLYSIIYLIMNIKVFSYSNCVPGVYICYFVKISKHFFWGTWPSMCVCTTLLSRPRYYDQKLIATNNMRWQQYRDGSEKLLSHSDSMPLFVSSIWLEQSTAVVDIENCDHDYRKVRCEISGRVMLLYVKWWELQPMSVVIITICLYT